MQKFQSKDLASFTQIVQMRPEKLHKTLNSILIKQYGKKNVVNNKDYLYAIGTIPIALIAHLDTVFPRTPAEVFYDSRYNVVWSPDGLGADDRAGVFAILKILGDGYHPHIIFTEGEERGGIGATALSKLQCPFVDLKYMIELDRRGANDCVFYGCDNQKFNSYIEKFGFVTNFGTYSDISDLAPNWGIAATNLSIGYRDEHSVSEVLFVGHMYNTINKVENMLDNVPKDAFEYVPGLDDYYFKCTCDHCHRIISYYEAIPVKGIDGYTSYWCCDCAANHGIDWCDICYQGYKEELLTKGVCPECLKEGYKDHDDYLKRTARKYKTKY